MKMFHQHARGAAARLAPTAKLLIADTEDYFCADLIKTSERRGIEAILASSVDHATQIIEKEIPDYVVVDQHMQPDGVLQVLRVIKSVNRKAKCVVVTRYPSLACAVKAIKLGAWDYLAKPTSAETVLYSFAVAVDDAEAVMAYDQPMSVNRLEWEHIHRILALNNNNISATARALRMHRRTLQRKLAKHPRLR